MYMAFKRPLSMGDAWDHLPNAKHIDRVLAHTRAHPNIWKKVVLRNDAWYKAWNAAWGRPTTKASLAAHSAAFRCIIGECPGTRHAIMALIAFDDCAYMLDFTPEQIHLYACLDVPAAVLLEPAVKAMHNEL